MKNRLSPFGILCALLLLVFAVFMFWYIPSSASLRAKNEETRQALETSIGREGKQQDEYDKAVADLPVVQEELKEKQPLAEAAAQKVTDLKARRKELRAEKKALEAAQSPDEAQGTDQPESEAQNPDKKISTDQPESEAQNPDEAAQSTGTESEEGAKDGN